MPQMVPMVLFTPIIFLGCLLAYFKIANRFNIVDIPNRKNSAHSTITIRGAGVIFPISILFYYLINHPVNLYFLLGLLLISLVSFMDDIRKVSGLIRLFFQMISLAILLYQIHLGARTGGILLFALFILGIGTINAMNFMDGINGLLGLYSLATLATLLYVNNYVIHFVDNIFMLYIVSAVLVFCYFNVREKAKCFAGDVGSISIGYIIIYLLILLVVKSQRIDYFLLLSVYGIDFTLTLAQRLWQRKNIFEVHRSHLYQDLVHKIKLTHIEVAIMYMVAQLLINLLVVGFVLRSSSMTAGLLFLVFLVLIYTLIKAYIAKIC